MNCTPNVRQAFGVFLCLNKKSTIGRKMLDNPESRLYYNKKTDQESKMR